MEEKESIVEDWEEDVRRDLSLEERFDAGEEAWEGWEVRSVEISLILIFRQLYYRTCSFRY